MESLGDKQAAIVVFSPRKGCCSDPRQRTRAMFIPLPAMPEHHTMDGIHLNAAGYEVGDKAIVRGIESALCKSTRACPDLTCHQA